jgi:nascent polypeptide-associated complex subunit alpha
MMPGLGGDPRQMAMMMRKLGIDVKEIEDVQQVVVRTAAKEYVFDKASVSVMKAQGVETWQVSGKPRVVERAGDAGAGAGEAASAIQPPAADTVLPISPEDVALVMKETGKSHAQAKAALEATKGDLAEAILRLSS